MSLLTLAWHRVEISRCPFLASLIILTSLNIDVPQGSNTFYFSLKFNQILTYLNSILKKKTGSNNTWETQSNDLRPVCRLRSEKWMDVQVGDIIKLENNQFVTVSETAHNSFSFLFPTDFTASCKKQMIFIIGQKKKKTLLCFPGGPPAAVQQRTAQPGLHRDGRTGRVCAPLLIFSGYSHSLLADLASVLVLFHCSAVLTPYFMPHPPLLQRDQPEGETVSVRHWRTGG